MDGKLNHHSWIELKWSRQEIVTYGTRSSFNPERNSMGTLLIVGRIVSDGQIWWQSKVRYLAGGIIL